MTPRSRVLTAALVLLAGCTSPAPSATPTAAAPTPTPITGPAACPPDQLTLAAGPSGGAAGTSYLEVQVVSQAAEPCVIFRQPSVQVVDATGAVMVETEASTGPGETVTLGDRLTFNLGWSSWCGDLPARPYVLMVWLTGASEASSLELPDSYGPSGCLGASSIVTFQPAS